MVQRRPPTAKHGAGALELPGGKLEPGEGPRAALARELREEWGPRASELEIGAVAEVLHHVYPAPGPEVILVVLHVDARGWSQVWRERIVPEPGVELLAFELEMLPLEQFLAADRPFLAGLSRSSPGPFAAEIDVHKLADRIEPDAAGVGGEQPVVERAGLDPG